MLDASGDPRTGSHRFPCGTLSKSGPQVATSVSSAADGSKSERRQGARIFGRGALQSTRDCLPCSDQWSTTQAKK